MNTVTRLHVIGDGVLRGSFTIEFCTSSHPGLQVSRKKANCSSTGFSERKNATDRSTDFFPSSPWGKRGLGAPSIWRDVQSIGPFSSHSDECGGRRTLACHGAIPGRLENGAFGERTSTDPVVGASASRAFASRSSRMPGGDGCAGAQQWQQAPPHSPKPLNFGFRVNDGRQINASPVMLSFSPCQPGWQFPNPLLNGIESATSHELGFGSKTSASVSDFSPDVGAVVPDRCKMQCHIFFGLL